jgi:hypothetical protein
MAHEDTSFLRSPTVPPRCPGYRPGESKECAPLSTAQMTLHRAITDRLFWDPPGVATGAAGSPPGDVRAADPWVAQPRVSPACASARRAAPPLDSAHHNIAQHRTPPEARIRDSRPEVAARRPLAFENKSALPTCSSAPQGVMMSVLEGGVSGRAGMSPKRKACTQEGGLRGGVGTAVTSARLGAVRAPSAPAAPAAAGAPQRRSARAEVGACWPATNNALVASLGRQLVTLEDPRRGIPDVRPGERPGVHLNAHGSDTTLPT